MCYTVELSVKTDDVSRNFSNKETKFQLTHDSSLVSLPRGRKTLLGENVRNDAILVLWSGQLEHVPRKSYTDFR